MTTMAGAVAGTGSLRGSLLQGRPPRLHGSVTAPEEAAALPPLYPFRGEKRPSALCGSSTRTNAIRVALDQGLGTFGSAQGAGASARSKHARQRNTDTDSDAQALTRW